MSERSEYRPGEFCWVDLATNDVDAAKAFYAELLGAETEAAPGDPEQNGHYGFLMRDGKRVAGYGDTMGPDQPPAWSSYVAVASADETAEKVKVAGGNVLMEPFDLPGDSGRMAVCRDAEGAFFSIYQSRGNTGAADRQRGRHLDVEQPAHAGSRRGEALLRGRLRLGSRVEPRYPGRHPQLEGRATAVAGGTGRLDGDARDGPRRGSPLLGGLLHGRGPGPRDPADGRRRVARSWRGRSRSRSAESRA